MMATFFLSLLIILASLAGLGIGTICGRPRVGGGCRAATNPQDASCECGLKPATKVPHD